MSKIIKNIKKRLFLAEKYQNISKQSRKIKKDPNKNAFVFINIQRRIVINYYHLFQYFIHCRIDLWPSNMRIVGIVPTAIHYHTRQRKFLLWNVFRNNNTGIPLLAISRLREPNLQ